MKIKINVNKERFGELTVAALVALEDMDTGQEPSARALRELVAPFMTDDDGNYLEESVAFATLDRIKQKNFYDLVVVPFMEQSRDMLVPKENGNSSTPSPKPEAEGQPGSAA